MDTDVRVDEQEVFPPGDLGPAVPRRRRPAVAFQAHDLDSVLGGDRGSVVGGPVVYRDDLVATEGGALSAFQGRPEAARDYHGPE